MITGGGFGAQEAPAPEGAPPEMGQRAMAPSQPQVVEAPAVKEDPVEMSKAEARSALSQRFGMHPSSNEDPLRFAKRKLAGASAEEKRAIELIIRALEQK